MMILRLSVLKKVLNGAVVDTYQSFHIVIVWGNK